MKEKPSCQKMRGAGALAALAFALPAVLGGCGDGRSPSASPDVDASGPAQAVSSAVTVEALAPAGRADILAAAAAAADAAASGQPLPKASAALIDRTFELRLPFVCGSSAIADGGSWSLDPRTRVLKISVRPQLWGDDPAMRALASGIRYDGAEGFWIERPWTQSEECPPPTSISAAAGASAPSGPGSAPNEAAFAVGPEPAPQVRQTLALVQFFAPDSPRNLRRGPRPYGYTGKVPATVSATPPRYRLRLTGRISGFGDGQPVHCAVLAASEPPLCAVAVEFAKVNLEDANTGESLAEWSN